MTAAGLRLPPRGIGNRQQAAGNDYRPMGLRRTVTGWRLGREIRCQLDGKSGVPTSGLSVMCGMDQADHPAPFRGFGTIGSPVTR